MAAHIEANDAAVAGQRGHPRAPAVEVAARGVVQQHGRGGSPGVGEVVHVVVEWAAVEFQHRHRSTAC